jgi:hypothetical protein
MFCPHCGQEVAEVEIFCHHCGTKLRAEEPVPGAEAAPGPAGREKTAWEDRASQGFVRGLFKTVNHVLFRPSDFFKKMPLTGGLTDPLLYALILGMVGVIFSSLWEIMSRGALENIMPTMQTSRYELFPGISMAVLAFLSPFLVIIALFVAAGILHLCLMVVKGARSGFETTFRVVSYACSAMVFLTIPFCGNAVALVWVTVLSIIGLREAHETTGGKAAFAVFLPVIVFCGLMTMAVAVFLGAAAGSLGILTGIR